MDNEFLNPDRAGLSHHTTVMKIFLCFSILFLLSQYSIAAPPGNPFRYNPDTGPPAPFPAAASAQPAAAQPAAAQPADRPHDNSNGGRQRPARDYKCSLCGKEYTNSKNLGYIAHMVQDDHIADTGEKKDGHPGKYRLQIIGMCQ